MERPLRARHVRVWIFLGPALVAATIALLFLRPRVEPALDPLATPPTSGVPSSPSGDAR